MLCCCLSSMGPGGENRWQSTRWCLQTTQGFDWAGNGWKVKSCWSQGGICRPGSHFTSVIPVTSPWNPELPLQHNQCPQPWLCSCLSTGCSADNLLPHGGERKVWAQEKLFHLKAAKSWWHPTGKNVEEEMTSQHQLCSTAQPPPGEPSWPLTRDLKGTDLKVYDGKGFRSYRKLSGIFIILLSSEKCMFKFEHPETKSVINLLQFSEKTSKLQIFWWL